MLHIIWIAVTGLIVGALAKLIMPGRDPGGIFVTMLLGIAGSALGTWIGRLFGLYRDHVGADGAVTGHRGAGFFMSLLGAILLLAIYHFIRRRTTGGTTTTYTRSDTR